jgi:hypothetical protein
MRCDNCSIALSHVWEALRHVWENPMPQHKRKARRLHGGGRPRKDGPRTKSGRLSRAGSRNPELRDHGTKQLVAKREAMIDGAAPELSAAASS